MQTLLLILSLILNCHWAESAPVGLGTLEFDNLDTDLDNLSYEVEEEDLDDFGRNFKEQDARKDSSSDEDKNVQTSGYKKKSSSNNGSKRKHNIQDLKKLYKSSGVHDQGSYDDDDIYAIVEGASSQDVGIKGNEDRTFRKGTKTRGFHRVHHKDEYKKDKLFYEDDEIKGTIKKIGAKDLGYKIGAGARTNKGHFHHDHQKGGYGKKGSSDKGFSEREYKGYSDSQGQDSYYNN